MPGHDTHQPHGSGVPELELQTHTGRFGYLFPPLPSSPPPARLVALAKRMATAPEDPKDGPDDEESHIPSAYTYLGQFIDHDLTFDPSSFAETAAGNNQVSMRTPRFDLDSVYGRGPGDQPFLYQPDGRSLALGDELADIPRNPRAHDLPRLKTGIDPKYGAQWRAVIGDPRNDENVIVSQLQGILYRFHNRLAAANPTWSFREVRSEVVRYYQWIVVHDFLPLIVIDTVLNSISMAIRFENLSFGDHPPVTRLYNGLAGADLPYEFSGAAYRMGHSMVRASYGVNDLLGQALPIFDPVHPQEGLNAFGAFPANFTIDWQRFIDLGLNNDGNPQVHVQHAYKIDTTIVDPLAHLPKSVAGDEAVADPNLSSLAYRNLARGHMQGLQSGQAIARAMNVRPLADDRIWIGPALRQTGTPADEPNDAVLLVHIDPEFADNCPLWTYVLAESRHNFFHRGAAQLGEVGGRIVAETFLGLLARDPNSVVNTPDWKPTLTPPAARFTLADMIRYALGG